MWANKFHDSVLYALRPDLLGLHLSPVNQSSRLEDRLISRATYLFCSFCLDFFVLLNFVFLKLDNLTLVSSKLRAQVNSSEQATLELLERTQNRETNLTGISSGSFIHYDSFVAITSAQMCFLTHCLSGCRHCAQR